MTDFELFLFTHVSMEELLLTDFDFNSCTDSWSQLRNRK